MLPLQFLLIMRQQHIADESWHNTWQFELNPEGHDEGVSVHLIGCPVFDFAKEHGYLEIMPALCHSDYKIIEPFHCKMIRYHTVANGDEYCDFWQVGDKSSAWKKIAMPQPRRLSRRFFVQFTFNELDKFEVVEESDYAFSNRMYDCLYNFCSNCLTYTV